MICFLKGKVSIINFDSICLEVNGIGYKVYVSDPTSCNINQEVFVYTYMSIKENDLSLYGFFNHGEKELFIKLLSVKGIGPKIALSILSNDKIDNIINSIESDDLNYLKKIPGIGHKAASQIILDLKGHLKFDKKDLINKNDNFITVKEALKSLGFKAQEIDVTLTKIQDENIEINEYIIKALQYLNRK